MEQIGEGIVDGGVILSAKHLALFFQEILNIFESGFNIREGDILLGYGCGEICSDIGSVDVGVGHTHIPHQRYYIIKETIKTKDQKSAQ